MSHRSSRAACTWRTRLLAATAAALASLVVLPAVSSFVMPDVVSGATGTTWLAAEHKWTGYVWPLPTALASLATSAYVEPTQAVTTTPGVPDPVAIFRSFAAFKRMVQNGAVSPEVHRVAYDPEKWADTPLVEQQDPVKYMQAFTALAHQHGLQSSVVPGRDLVLVTGAVCSKRNGETVSQAFVRCDIAAGGVGADSFVIQAAPVQTTGRAFGWFVGAVSHQLRTASPTTRLLATVRATSAMTPTLLTLIDSTLPTLDGFEVNCTNHTVLTAIDLLQRAQAG